jgi:hypothetical protein
LAEACAARGIALVFKRVEQSAVAMGLQGLPHARRAGLAQGRAWGAPHSLLGAEVALMYGARGHDDGRGCGCMHAADA